MDGCRFDGRLKVTLCISGLERVELSLHKLSLRLVVRVISAPQLRIELTQDTAGDTVGLGFHRLNRTIFLTKNGKLVGVFYVAAVMFARSFNNSTVSNSCPPYTL